VECCSPLRGVGGWVHQITKFVCNVIHCIKLPGAESVGSPDGQPPLTWYYGHNNVTEDPFGAAVPLSFTNFAHSKNLDIGVEPPLFLSWGWTRKFAEIFMVLNDEFYFRNLNLFKSAGTNFNWNSYFLVHPQACMYLTCYVNNQVSTQQGMFITRYVHYLVLYVCNFARS
jgi:hypothetical protein